MSKFVNLFRIYFLALNKQNGYITVSYRSFWLFQRANKFHYILGIHLPLYKGNICNEPQITSYMAKILISCCPCFKTMSVRPYFCSKQSISSAVMSPPSLRNLLVALPTYRCIFFLDLRMQTYHFATITVRV